MRIRYLSDLHLEFDASLDIQRGDEDVVVLGGDIHLGIEGIKWAQEKFPTVPVIYVLGNHEFYGHDFDELVTEARNRAARTNVHLLEQDSVVIGGIRFLGCTLWTDFDALGKDRRNEAMEEAQTLLSDYLRIHRSWTRRRIVATETRARHLESRRWLEAAIAESAEPVVVVTHHAPIIEGSAERYREDPLSPAFVSDLRALMVEPIRLWIFGHTHHCAVHQEGAVLLLSNQAGYPNETNPGFSRDRVVEIDPDGGIEAKVI